LGHQDLSHPKSITSHSRRTRFYSLTRHDSIRPGFKLNIMRISTGIIAILLLAAGAFLYSFRPDVDPIVTGMLVRIGALMGVIWLAFPELKKLQGRAPAYLVGVGALCLVVLVAKPNIGKVLVMIVTIAISVGGVLKWLSKLTQPPSSPPQSSRRK
jgi:hypothetical protein